MAFAYFFYISKTDFISSNQRTQWTGFVALALSFYEAIIVPFVPGAPSLIGLVDVIFKAI